MFFQSSCESSEWGPAETESLQEPLWAANFTTVSWKQTANALLCGTEKQFFRWFKMNIFFCCSSDVCQCKKLHRTENIPRIWPEWADFQSCRVIFLVATALHLLSELQCLKFWRLGPHTLTTYVQSTLGAVPLPGRNLIIWNRKHTFGHFGDCFELKMSKKLSFQGCLIFLRKALSSRTSRLTYPGEKWCRDWIFGKRRSTARGCEPGRVQSPAIPAHLPTCTTCSFWCPGSQGSLRTANCVTVKEELNLRPFLLVPC